MVVRPMKNGQPDSGLENRRERNAKGRRQAKWKAEERKDNQHGLDGT